MKMNRGRTRMTRKPSTVSSADSVRSCWDVTTVTSCPRRASSLESDRTWLSTPPTCGENQGDTWAIRTPVTSEDPAPRRDVSPRVGPRAKEGLFPDDGTRVDRRVDAHLHVVPHDHAKLPQSGLEVDTGLRKLGVIMGDDVKVGINASIDAGTIVGEESFLGPGAHARGNIAPRSRIF